MSNLVVVRCPSCGQKYRLDPRMIGRRGRCKQCKTEFLIASEQPLDDDAIVALITDGDPSSKSVMGSTGIFEQDNGADVHESQIPRVASTVRPGSVRLRSLDAAGAHFVFSAAAMVNDELRNSFPRKCIGCGARTGLHVHLLYWPERLGVHDTTHMRDRLDKACGRLEDFEHSLDKELLRQLPHTSHVREPFTLPFPVFACEFCRVSREVEAHVESTGSGDVCKLRIASLAVAVEFFRANGGRDTPEYRKLVEARDLKRDPWRELAPTVRQKLSTWMNLADGEQYLAFYSDAETDSAHSGTGGVILTNRRLLVRKGASRGEYALSDAGRLEIVAKGDQAAVHIYETGHPPTVIRMERRMAEDLTAAMRRQKSPWAILA